MELISEAILSQHENILLLKTKIYNNPSIKYSN